jgi:hypothetical protein
MSMAPRRSLLSVLALASALALSACGGSTQPNASGTPSATETPSPTPTVDTRPTPASSTGPARNILKPELPESAKQNTGEGFEAFTQYWFDTITYALETGDTAPLKAASTEECKMCNSFIDEASKDFSEGSWNVGPKWQVVSFQPHMALDPLGQVVGYFQLEESPSAKYTKDGTPVLNGEGRPAQGAEAIYAKFEGGQWLVSEAGGA